MRVCVDANGVIREARIAYGGMAATPARASAAGEVEVRTEGGDGRATITLELGDT